MGVFLDATVPAEGDALPTMLQYATPEQRNQLGQSPALRQPFYIGDGRTRDGQRQLITVPAGATRLYLGVMDSAQWNDNPVALEGAGRSDGDRGLPLESTSGERHGDGSGKRE